MPFSRTREDLATARHRDPAARSGLEVWLTYSGLHAIWGHRLSHRLWMWRRYLLARVVSQLARFLTGDDEGEHVIGKELGKFGDGVAELVAGGDAVDDLGDHAFVNR